MKYHRGKKKIAPNNGGDRFMPQWIHHREGNLNMEFFKLKRKRKKVK